MPSQGIESLGRNVDVRLGLDGRVRLESIGRREEAYFDSVKDLDDARMP